VLPFAIAEVAELALETAAKKTKVKLKGSDMMGGAPDADEFSSEHEDEGGEHEDDDKDGEEDDDCDDPEVEEVQIVSPEATTLPEDMLRVWHTSLVCQIERPEDVISDRHKQVWKWSISWEHLNRRSVKGHPLRIVDKTDQEVWNRGREAMRKKKSSERQKEKRAAKNKIVSKRKRVSGESKGHGGDEEGHVQESDFIASGAKGTKIQCSGSADELARLCHAMVDDRAQEALRQLVVGFPNRQVLDDKANRVLPWVVFAEIYNDQEFNPTNHFLEDPNSVERLRDIDPSNLEREIENAQLKGVSELCRVFLFR